MLNFEDVEERDGQSAFSRVQSYTDTVLINI